MPEMNFEIIPKHIMYSKPFEELNGRRIRLLLYMRYEYWKAENEDVFTFPLKLADEYGLYTRGNRKQFYGDIGVLEQYGYIEVERDKENCKKNTYRFTDRWNKSQNKGSV